MFRQTYYDAFKNQTTGTKIKTSLSASVKTTIIAATLISGALLAGMLVSPSQSEVFAQVAEGPSCFLLEDESVECDDDSPIIGSSPGYCSGPTDELIPCSGPSINIPPSDCGLLETCDPLDTVDPIPPQDMER